MTDLIVQVHADADDERQDLLRLTHNLRKALLDLDVDAVESLAPTDVPDGAKGGGPVETLGVKLGVVALRKAIDKIREWISRNGRSIEVTIDGDTIKLTGGTAAQQEQLFDLWIARHAPRS